MTRLALYVMINACMAILEALPVYTGKTPKMAKNGVFGHFRGFACIYRQNPQKQGFLAKMAVFGVFWGFWAFLC